MGLLAVLCEIVTGHHLGAWEPFAVPESQYADFERSRCRWCRAGYVRARRLPAPATSRADDAREE